MERTISDNDCDTLLNVSNSPFMCSEHPTATPNSVEVCTKFKKMLLFRDIFRCDSEGRPYESSSILHLAAVKCDSSVDSTYRSL